MNGDIYKYRDVAQLTCPPAAPSASPSESVACVRSTTASSAAAAAASSAAGSYSEPLSSPLPSEDAAACRPRAFGSGAALRGLHASAVRRCSLAEATCYSIRCIRAMSRKTEVDQLQSKSKLYLLAGAAAARFCAAGRRAVAAGTSSSQPSLAELSASESDWADTSSSEPWGQHTAASARFAGLPRALG